MADPSTKLRPVLEDSATRREHIRRAAVDGLRNAFPMKAGRWTVELSDPRVDPEEFSSRQQKQALLEGRTLSERVRGTLTVKGPDGTVADQVKDFTLMRLPYFTPRHTFILEGTEYSVANQLRQKPGVYVHRRGNEELEAQFNLSKGANMKMSMDPQKGLLYITPTHTSSKIALYPVLRALGMPHQDIASAWGAAVAAVNRDSTGNPEKHVDKLYNAVLDRPGRPRPPTPEARASAIREYFDTTRMDPEVTEITLGKPLDRVSSQALAAAGRKILDVYRQAEDVDDRDSLAFKTFHSIDDFVRERLGLDARAMRNKLGWKLDASRGKLREALPSGPFTRSFHNFLTGSSLSSVPTQINPMELISQASKVTMLGEGAIPSERAIPMDARDVHPTHLAILDPVRIPECYDELTEVFTSKGWKRWPDVQSTDLLACRVDGRLEFHRPRNLVNEAYEGLMYGVKTSKISYLVTPNHRVLCKPLENRGAQRWRINRADDVHGKARHFDTGHEPYRGESTETFELPRVDGSNNVINVGPILMTDWASFMGWYLSEGCFVYDEKTPNYDVLISQDERANPENCQIITALLSRLPFRWCFRDGDTFVIGMKQLAAYVKQFGHAADKFIPEYFFEASVEARENLLEALLLGGGRFENERRRTLCTGSSRLAADFERLAISLGKPTRTRRYIDKRDPRYLPIYEVRVQHRRHRQALPKRGDYRVEMYNGRVFCAEVPGGLLYVRRDNRLPLWSGNSFHAGVDVRAAIGAMRDDKNNLYATLRNISTGKDEHLLAAEVAKRTVAFPGQNLGAGKMVDAMHQGKVVRVPASQVTHEIRFPTYMYGPTTNLLPLIGSMQGNRALMASKHQEQALPLVNREAPLVQVASSTPGVSMEQELAKITVPTAREDGVVTKIDDDYIYLSPREKRGAAGQITKLHYDKDLPLASKTYLDNKLLVKPGDEVREGQLLADSNFIKDGTLALGTNLRVAYMPARGFNSNDGIVISQSAADKLTSEHMYRHTVDVSGEVEPGREKHRTYYGSRYTAKQYDNLDADGVVKPGAVVQKGDPLIVALRPSKLTGDAALLGKLSKSLVKPYKEVVETWTHDNPGVVADVVKTGNLHTVTVKTREPMQIADKLSNRYGAKGVVAKILPDNQIVHDEQGRPVDVILTSAGIITRINPAQLIEASLGKVAEKTGKPIIVPQFMPGEAIKFAKDELKKAGLTDKETVTDPVTGKKIPGVFVGRSYFLKLFKTADTGWSAHSPERYDYNEQPARGGDEGAKGIGKMEFDGLVGHNARNILRESASIKSQRNDEFWRAVQLGLPTPAPRTPFVYDKLHSMLTGAGIRVDKRGSRLALGPLTDADITKMSSGALPSPSKMIRAKDLRPEDGGLFDPAKTGGVAGTKWSHVDLTEPIVNPVFEEPVRRLLGLTQKEFDERVGQGGSWFRSELGKIDIDSKLEELRDQTRKLRGPALDGAVKQVKYLEALRAMKLTPDKAYVLSKIPVTPPIIRPVLPLPDGKLQVGDANLLYRDAFLANDKLREVSDVLPDAELRVPRKHLYDAVAALFGVGDPVSPGVNKRDAKGYITAITGTRPGSGFFQAKLLKRQQDPSGRAVITPGPTLNMDEVGVPEEMLRKMYSPFVIGRLVRRGYPALEAKRLVEENHPVARDELVNEARERPVFINRAPSLTRHNIIAAYPVLVGGKNVVLNPFAEKGLNADYDGDTVQVHAPVTSAGIDDAKKMMLSRQLFADRKPNMINVAPEMESVLGLYRATRPQSDKRTRSFASTKDAVSAYHRGEIELNDPIKIDE